MIWLLLVIILALLVLTWIVFALGRIAEVTVRTAPLERFTAAIRRLFSKSPKTEPAQGETFAAEIEPRDREQPAPSAEKAPRSNPYREE